MLSPTPHDSTEHNLKLQQIKRANCKMMCVNGGVYLHTLTSLLPAHTLRTILCIFLWELTYNLLEGHAPAGNTGYPCGGSLIRVVNMSPEALSVMYSVCIYKRNVFMYYMNVKLISKSSIRKHVKNCTNFLCCIDKHGDNATMGSCPSGESGVSV